MITVIRQGYKNDCDEQWHHYQISGQYLRSSERINALNAFRVDDNALLSKCQQANSNQSCSIDSVLDSNANDFQYNGLAQFNDKLRDVQFIRKGELGQLDVEGEAVSPLLPNPVLANRRYLNIEMISGVK